MIDEAWSKRSLNDFKINTGNRNKIFKIDMNRKIGKAGEQHIAIVIKKGTTSEIITAYPVK